MKFDLPRKQHPNLERYYKEDLDKVYRFANELYKELGGLIRAVVISAPPLATRAPREGTLTFLLSLMTSR
jgi:hypothetical protein